MERDLTKQEKAEPGLFAAMPAYESFLNLDKTSRTQHFLQVRDSQQKRVSRLMLILQLPFHCWKIAKASSVVRLTAAVVIYLTHLRRPGGCKIAIYFCRLSCKLFLPAATFGKWRRLLSTHAHVFLCINYDKIIILAKYSTCYFTVSFSLEMLVKLWCVPPNSYFFLSPLKIKLIIKCSKVVV